MFLIHHTSSDEVIDEVLVDCLDILCDVGEATLEETETRKFADIVATIPESILSDDTVKTGRRQERQLRDLKEKQKESGREELPEDMDGRFQQMHKMLRSIEILG